MYSDDYYTVGKLAAYRRQEMAEPGKKVRSLTAESGEISAGVRILQAIFDVSAGILSSRWPRRIHVHPANDAPQEAVSAS